MIVPIPIFIREKSKEELERDRMWREIRERDERNAELRRLREKREKEEYIRRKKEESKKIAEIAYREARDNNPWDFQFMPEGWSMLGQGQLKIVKEY